MQWLSLMTQIFQVRLRGYCYHLFGILSWALFYVLIGFCRTESIGVFFEPQATLNLNKTLTLQFEVKNCQKYWTAVWIKIFVQNEVTITSGEKKSTQFVLQIPKDCLKKRGNVFGLTLPSIANKACTFPLIELSECKVYTVEITPIYLTLQGRPSSVEFTVPPEVSLYLKLKIPNF